MAHLSEREWELLQTGLRAPWTVPTSSMGRLFDVVAALLGLVREATYEAQAAIRLEAPAVRAGGSRQGIYPWHVAQGEISIGGALQGVVEDVARGEKVPDIARRFHETVADMVVTVGEELAESWGISRVALSGGCFQNRLLVALCARGLRNRGLTPLFHRSLPPNDACVSLGQAVAARLQYRVGDPR